VQPQVHPYQKTKILERRTAYPEIKKSRCHAEKIVRHIHPNNTTFPKIDFQTRRYLEASQHRLNSPQIVNHSFSNAQCIIRIL
jgi:hypothetical protein